MNDLQKKVRIKSPNNISFVKSLPCSIRSRDCEGDTQCHHWKTVGSGGDDKLSNLVPLCAHHHSQFHTIGKRSFLERYSQIISLFRDKYELPELEDKEWLR